MNRLKFHIAIFAVLMGAVWTIAPSAMSAMSVVPSSVDFGEVDMGTSISETVQISDVIFVIGVGIPDNLKAISSFSAKLSDIDRNTAIVTYTPLAVGPASAVMQIMAFTTNGPESRNVPLSGVGIGAETEVDIDIKPGSDPNSINLKSRGIVPVAILTTENHDASVVDPDTVQFAGSDPVRWNDEDVDGDGDLDRLFHFRTQDLVLDADSTEASLLGTTYDGSNIVGIDSVNIVPQDSKKAPQKHGACLSTWGKVKSE